MTKTFCDCCSKEMDGASAFGLDVNTARFAVNPDTGVPMKWNNAIVLLGT